MAECRSCGKPVEWGIFASGKRMPLDPVSRSDGNIVREFDSVTREFLEKDGTRLIRVLHKDEVPEAIEKRFVSHFTTCPNAKGHRR